MLEFGFRLMNLKWIRRAANDISVYHLYNVNKQESSLECYHNHNLLSDRSIHSFIQCGQYLKEKAASRSFFSLTCVGPTWKIKLYHWYDFVETPFKNDSFILQIKHKCFVIPLPSIPPRRVSSLNKNKNEIDWIDCLHSCSCSWR